MILGLGEPREGGSRAGYTIASAADEDMTVLATGALAVYLKWGTSMRRGYSED